mgnify:CR=1 FL=1
MKNWYSNKKVGIFFDDYPQVAVRYYIPSMTTEEKKSIEKYPFICKKELKVKIKDFKKNKEYNFAIPKGYCYDGASIPRIFWRIIGANTDNKFLIPALIHDTLCENHQFVDNNRALSTNIFDALLEACKITKPKRFLMKNSVACFQTLFCKW